MRVCAYMYSHTDIQMYVYTYTCTTCAAVLPRCRRDAVEMITREHVCMHI